MFIPFDISAALKIHNDCTFTELVNSLQFFTSKHLYIENEKLKFVDNITQIEYDKCKLIEYNNGFFLEEIKGQKRVLQVFSKPLAEYLLEDKSLTESFDSLTELFDSLTESFDSIINSSDSIIESSESIIESSESIIESSESIIESSESIIESSESIIESSESIIESSDTVNSEEHGEKLLFRLFLGKKDDIDEIDSVNINKKILKIIEEENMINLEETIKISFSRFLETKGIYNSNISLIFQEDIFAEIFIETYIPLSTELINFIEENAQLNLDNDDIIYFRLRTLETYISLDESIEKIEDRGELYTNSIPLSRLPIDLAERVLNVIYHLSEKNNTINFIYEGNSFTVVYEGNNSYIVLDNNLYLSLSHLSPELYCNASSVKKFAKLPIARFTQLKIFIK